MTDSAPEVATEPLRPAEELGEPRPSTQAGVATMMLGALGDVISLVFWTITLIVSVKFVTFIMRAAKHGEGGIMALVALVRGVEVRSRHRTSWARTSSFDVYPPAVFVYGEDCAARRTWVFALPYPS